MPGTVVVILKSKNVFCLFINSMDMAGILANESAGTTVIVTF